MTAAPADSLPDERELAVAFLAVTGRSPDPRQENALRAGGWTRLALHAVNRLAHYAESAHTALTRTSIGLPVQGAEQDSMQRHSAVLLSVAEQWSPDLPLMARLSWLTILATTHDPKVLTDLVGSSYKIIGSSTVTRWTDRLGAETAPLAYAAGLSLDEAQASLSSRHTADSLRALAALRGLPVDPARLLAEAAHAHPWLVD